MDSKLFSDRTNTDENSSTATYSHSSPYTSELFRSMSQRDPEKADTSLSDENSYESRKKIVTGLEIKEDGEETQVIQILLPCIICNRTFSPEALERHSKVCTKVNVKTPWKPERGVFDSTEQRIKGTKVADFIPPPVTADALTDSLFSRRCRNRASLRGTSCTTRSTLNSNYGRTNSTGSPTAAPTNTLGSTSSSAPWRRSRSLSRQPEEKSRKSSIDPSVTLDDNSDYGSNTSDENAHNGRITNQRVPSYLKSLSPQELCPYCHRSFGLKAFDRHVSFCKELFERKQYELQPITQEKEEAMQRQEIRTKYRPMKSSSSLSSLRSMSPARDFANMAFKFFGGLRRPNNTPVHGNYYNGNIIGSGASKHSGIKKSNESLASSCYGDYPPSSIGRSSPSPLRRMHSSTSFNNYYNPHQGNKIHNDSDLMLNSPTNNYQGTPARKPSMLPLRINSTGPKKTRSIEHIPMKSPYGHVTGSGYGQTNQSFNRNSKTRATMQSTKDFFRSNKRVEPEGTENTNNLHNSKDHPRTSPLIITPMNLFSKPEQRKMNDSGESRESSSREESRNPYGLYNSSSASSQRDDTGVYDPYEKAAKQLEELLKTQPVRNHGGSKKTTRRCGLEKAFESVGVPTAPTTNIMTVMNMDGKKVKGNIRPSANLMSRSLHSFDNGRGRSQGNNNNKNSGNDDNYWDEILERRDKTSHLFHQEGPQSMDTGNNNRRSSTNVNTGVDDDSTSNNEGIKALLSDSSLSSDPSTMSSADSTFNSGTRGLANHKSRAESNVSSADSAFSR